MESETYLLDGDMLIPNALGATWAPRVHGDRQDYTRQVETAVPADHPPRGARRGDRAATSGRFTTRAATSSGTAASPTRAVPTATTSSTTPDNPLHPTIDRSAIVTDENGNARAVVAVGAARRRRQPDQLPLHDRHYRYGANGWAHRPVAPLRRHVLCAKHTYLSSIDYTEAADVAPAPERRRRVPGRPPARIGGPPQLGRARRSGRRRHGRLRRSDHRSPVPGGGAPRLLHGSA